MHYLYLPSSRDTLKQCTVLLCNPGALGLLVNMPEGLREDPYHWTELPSLNKDYYHYYYLTFHSSLVLNIVLWQFKSPLIKKSSLTLLNRFAWKRWPFTRYSFLHLRAPLRYMLPANTQRKYLKYIQEYF